MKAPGPDHPITIKASEKRIVVRAAGAIVAESDNALVMRESNYPPVIYVPRGDTETGLLEPSDHHSYCPYKGDAGYFSIPSLGEDGKNAVWTYEQPYSAVGAIAGHLAFYASKVEITEG